jgi:glutathione S-transferase
MRVHGGISHSGYTQKVRIALVEKNLSARIPIVPVPHEERGTPRHRARNPLGLVPVLELDDGTFLPESSAIVEYLDALFPVPPLIPTDPLRRARMRVLDLYNDQALTPAVRRLWDAVLVPSSAGGDPDRIAAAARAEILTIYAYLDSVLGDAPYLVGEFSLADIAFMTRLQMLPDLGVEIPANCVRARAWEARLRARPSWAATAYPPLPDPVRHQRA